jgi:choline dehydrogenase-like flavoprotein
MFKRRCANVRDPSMLIDARELAFDAIVTCDVCIVGSGAAGTSAALELSDRGYDVVLLEAGAIRRTREYQATYQGEVRSSGLDEGSMHPPLDTVRVRKLGGTTGAWGGRCIPLDPIDFEVREYVDDSGWPITRDSLDPYYRRANAYCEAGEYEYSAKRALAVAEPFLLTDRVTAEITDEKLLRYSRPTDFGKVYRERLTRSRRARVLYHANVLRLQLGASGERVESAVVASAPGREFRVNARFFVIASGGLDTTRLLLESGTRSRSGVGSGHRLIGRYYMTHLDAFVGSLRFDGVPPTAAHQYELSRDGIYCRRLVCLTPEAQRSNRLLNFSAVLYMPLPDDAAHGDGLLSSFALAKDLLYRTRSGFKSRRHGMRRELSPSRAAHVMNVVRNPWDLPRFAADWTRRRWLASRKLPSFLVKPASGEYRLLFSAEQSPSAQNRVELADQWDAFGVRRLRVAWGVKEEDHESIVDNLEVVARNLRRLGVGTLDAPKTTDELREQMGGGFLGGTHAMGTTRMSASPHNGVVDPQCRVHGVANLYIASSSVFPTGGFAAPTLTIVALSIRIADAISAQI